MNSINKFCVYFHFTKDTHQVFYVGIGSAYRPKRFSGRNEMWNRIEKKHGFYSQVMFKELTWDAACELEIKYIKMFGKRIIKTGPLANITDGGDGTPGCKWNLHSKRTNDQRKRISASLKGRKVNPEAILNSVAAKKRNKEERDRLGIKRPKRILSDTELIRVRTMNIGRKRSAELNVNHSEKLKGRKKPPRFAEKISRKLKGIPKSEEHKRKVSEGVKRKWAEKRTWYYQL